MGEPATTADISNRASGRGRRRVARRRSARTPIARSRHRSWPPARPRSCANLWRKGEIHALVALGGTQGTTLSTAVMRALPYGFPKIMVSTMASGNVAPVGRHQRHHHDVFGDRHHGAEPVHAAHPRQCRRRRLRHGRGRAADSEKAKPLVAITTVGITTQGAMTAAEVLRGRRLRDDHLPRRRHRRPRDGGDDAPGPDRRGPRLFDDRGVERDASTRCSPAAPDRLTTAGRSGLPQVLCPGAIEVLVFNEPETVPAKYAGRASRPPQPADHRPPAEPRRDGRGRPRDRPKRLQSTDERRGVPHSDGGL